MNLNRNIAKIFRHTYKDRGAAVKKREEPRRTVIATPGLFVALAYGDGGFAGASMKALAQPKKTVFMTIAGQSG